MNAQNTNENTRQRSTKNSDKFSPTEDGLRRYVGCDLQDSAYGTYHINKKYRGFLIQQSTRTKSKRIAQVRLREAVDKLDKTFGATQVDRTVASGKATFAELVKIFKRDIDLSERENSTKTKIIYQLNGFVKHWTKMPERAAKGPFLELSPKELTHLDVKFWRRWFSEEFGADYTNNCLRYLRALYAIARKANPFIDDPTMGVEWTKQQEKELVLPSKDKCRELLDETHHKLRHYWATLALESGATPKIVAEWLGHQDGGVLVMKRYTHVRIEYSHEAAQRLGKTFTFIRSEASSGLPNATARELSKREN